MSDQPQSELIDEVVPHLPAHAPAPFSRRVISQLVAINLLWGASSVAAKGALAAFGPCTLASLRFLPAGVLLLLLARRQRLSFAIHRQDIPSLFGMGLLGIALTYGIFYNGQLRTSATDGALVIASEPIFIALFATLFLRERLRGMQWLGLLAGVGGIGLIAGHATGNVIALVALCVESSTSVLGKRLITRYPGLLLAGWEMVIGAALLLPFALREIALHPPVVTASALAGVAYLSLFCSAIAYGVWYIVLENAPVSSMGVFLLIQPLTGPLYGWLLRGEALTLQTACGGALVIVGILLTTLQPRR